MKIFGIGLNKTGTNSLNEALIALGYKSIHYPHDQQTYDKLTAGDVRLPILDEYDGVTDITIVPFYQQLERAYPDSKFVLTVRERDGWLRSMENHYRINENLYIPGRPARNPFFKEFAIWINVAVYSCYKFHAERYCEIYDRHKKEVIDYFAGKPGSRLLVMDICAGDGWDKLCPFLGKNVPSTPFPHKNPGAYDLPPVKH